MIGVLNSIETAAVRLNDLNWLFVILALILKAFSNLVDFHDLLHEATFDKEVAVWEQMNVLQHTHVLELNLAKRLACSLRKVKEISIFVFKNFVVHVFIIEAGLSMLKSIILFAFLFFLSCCSIFIVNVAVCLCACPEKILFRGKLVFVFSLMDFIFPPQEHGSGCLYVVLTLSVGILEEVEATWQHELLRLLAVSHCLAPQVAEITLRDSALLWYS